MTRPLFAIKPGEKTPVEKNYKATATTSEATIRKWHDAGFNLGYVPAHGGETVIDLDKHGEKDGEASLAEWEKQIGHRLPETFTVLTPTGGLHLYFKGVVPKDKDGFLPGVDIHCQKKYVVCPGSHTVANAKKKTVEGYYTIIDKREPAELPAWFIEEFSKRTPTVQKEATATPVSLIVTPDSENNVSRAVGIIANWPETTEGSRNVQLHQMMREVCKCGVTPKKAEELYYEYGIDRLNYGTDEAEQKEIHATILSAYGDMSDFGVDSYEAVTRSLPVSEDADEPDSWNTLASMTIPPRKWLIKDWLFADPGSVLLFTGRGGTGKSLIALGLCDSLATGEPWLGQEVLHRAKTLFVTCEDSREEVARRVQKIAAANGHRVIDDSLVKVWSRQGKANLLAIQSAGNVVAPGPFFAKLKKVCIQHFGNDGGILILDTVPDFTSIDENNRTQVSQFIKSILSDLATSAGISIILLAHPNKAGQIYSGSTAWEGSARSCWLLRWKDQDKNKNDVIGGPLVLQLAKSNTTMAGKEIVLKYDERFLPRVVEETGEDTGLKDMMVQMIADAADEGKPFGKSAQSARPIIYARILDPSTGVKLEEGEIKNLVGSLLAEGRIVQRDDHGKQVLVAEKGETE